MVNDLNNLAKTTLFTVSDIADRLKMSPKFVGNIIRRGELSAFNLAAPNKRAQYRISEEALTAYLDSKKVTVASAAKEQRCNVAKVPTIRDYFKVA